MNEMEDLEKIDLLRRRAHLSYEEARRLLAEHNNDVVEALVALEKQDRLSRPQAETAGEIIAGLEKLWRASRRTRFRLRQDDKTIVELPVAAGLVGALLAPEVAVLGAVAALFSRCTMEVIRPAQEG
ncbi:MAG: DUF4342 domain-containing protein [Firmicutes bacterium]|nr:DUF4342 domain-containing protein [Bacillota bacterium]